MVLPEEALAFGRRRVAVCPQIFEPRSELVFVFPPQARSFGPIPVGVANGYFSSWGSNPPTFTDLRCKVTSDEAGSTAVGSTAAVTVNSNVFWAFQHQGVVDGTTFWLQFEYKKNGIDAKETFGPYEAKNP
jgi:hypothetical protein